MQQSYVTVRFVGSIEPEALRAILRVMRDENCPRLRSGELEVWRDTPPAPVKPLTAEEKAAAAVEARRQKYRRQFGRDVSDEELDGLP